MGWIYVLAVGAVAGWLAGQLFRGYGYGLSGNIILGVLGSIVGFWLLDQLGIFLGNGIAATILTSVFGAMLILFVANLLRGRRHGRRFFL